MFVHFVLRTVVETLQLVLAPSSATPRKLVKSAIDGRTTTFAFQCSGGRHRSVAMAIMVGWLLEGSLPIEIPKWVKSFSKEGVSAVPGVSGVFGVPVLSATNPRTGGRGWSDPCKPTWMAWVQGVVQGLPGAPKQCSVFVNLWSCGSSDFLSPKTLFFFQAWLPCFAFLCTAEALVHATKKNSGKIGAHMVLALVIDPFCPADLWPCWEICSKLESLESLESPESLECLELTMSCKFFSRPVSPFYKVEISRQTSEKLQPTDIKQVCTRIWTHPS